MYKNINRLRGTQNKTNMLRLIQGDDYCGERLTKFKLSEIDTCIRCFEKETIKHLLTECPYTHDVWVLLGIIANDTKTVLGTHLTKAELQMHADLLLSIVFRKSALPPTTLIELTYIKYSIGLCRNNKVKEMARTMIDNHNTNGTWH